MPLEYPDKITTPIREVFSMEMNRVNSIATLYRNAGYDIDTSGAAERAFIFDRWVRFAIQHGEKWRHVAMDDVARVRDSPDVLTP